MRKKNLLVQWGLLGLLVLSGLAASCSKQQPVYNQPFAKGADVGWLSEMEHDSMVFRNAAGEEDDCLKVLKEIGVDAIRLRVWVNHSTGWSNLPDVLAMAWRVKDAGMRLMIDIHYSDFFADPQRQQIPAYWQDLNFDELCIAVGAHTTEVLETLRDANITPDWVQIGNETTNGMLWPAGFLRPQVVQAESRMTAEQLGEDAPRAWHQYARLSNSGYEAAKNVFPDLPCIIHVDNAFVPRVNWFRRFRQAGGKWDVIGLSHYPFTQDTIAPAEMNSLCAENISALYNEFGTPVMLVEIGTLQHDPEAAQACMADFRQKTDHLKGYVGVFYWEPQVYAQWRPAEYEPLGWGSYHMSAFTENGQPSEALKTLYRE